MLTQKNLTELSDLLHYPVGFEQDFIDALVVDQVLVCQLATFAVFEPFLGRLLTADVETPIEFWQIKALGFSVTLDDSGALNLLDNKIRCGMLRAFGIINGTCIRETFHKPFEDWSIGMLQGLFCLKLGSNFSQVFSIDCGSFLIVHGVLIISRQRSRVKKFEQTAKI